MKLKGLKALPRTSVIPEDVYCTSAFKKEVEYLLSLDTDKLLAGYRETAGLDMKEVTRYSGWENSLIGGHTLGHYLTACVMACESPLTDIESRNRLFDILQKIIDGLKECQDANGSGFLFGARILDITNMEAQFDNVEENQCSITTQSWVPWYNMHKLIAGLVSVARLKDEIDVILANYNHNHITRLSNSAISIVSRLADWVYNRTSSWSFTTRDIVLSIEYGGMNDCLYDVYTLTGKKDHLTAAHVFDEVRLFEKVYSSNPGDNILDELHANTTIPKFIGALKRYMITGEYNYLDYAEYFWQLVALNHTYITGNNSEWEHFGKDLILNSERTNCNCETCNAHNMLKLTRMLHEITGDAKYADWAENIFINTILSSIDYRTGMTTYFQPMASGYFKVFSDPYTKFWCCTGTGMENLASLSDGIYSIFNDFLVVDRYASCSVIYKSINISQTFVEKPSFTASFKMNAPYYGNLALRLPYWLTGRAVVSIDSVEYDYTVIHDSVMQDNSPAGVNSVSFEETFGYAVIAGPFEAGSVITISLPAGVIAYSLPDSPRTVAFKYGPYVLSALMGTHLMKRSVTGVDVTIPAEKFFDPALFGSASETITVLTSDADSFIADIKNHLIPDETSDSLRFILKDTNAKLVFVPHYSQYLERYGLYFTFDDDLSDVHMPLETVETQAAPVNAAADESMTESSVESDDESVSTVDSVGESDDETESAGDSVVESDDESVSTVDSVGESDDECEGADDSVVESEDESESAGDSVVESDDECESTGDSVGESIGDMQNAVETDILVGLSGCREASFATDDDVPNDNLSDDYTTDDNAPNDDAAADMDSIENVDTIADEDRIENEVSSFCENAEERTSMIKKLHPVCGAAYYKASQKTYLIRISSDSRLLTFDSQNCPVSYIMTIETCNPNAVVKLDGTEAVLGALSVSLTPEATFTYHILKVSDEYKTEEYKLITMLWADGKDTRPTAFDSTIGSFAGTLCYDISSSSWSAGTHNFAPSQMFGIDAMTGYFHGYTDCNMNTYAMELENGTYELAILTDVKHGYRLSAIFDGFSEKLLGTDSTMPGNLYTGKVTVKAGSLILKLDYTDVRMFTEYGTPVFSRILVRAAETSAVENSFTFIDGKDFDPSYNATAVYAFPSDNTDFEPDTAILEDFIIPTDDYDDEDDYSDGDADDYDYDTTNYADARNSDEICSNAYNCADADNSGYSKRNTDFHVNTVGSSTRAASAAGSKPAASLKASTPQTVKRPGIQPNLHQKSSSKQNGHSAKRVVKAVRKTNHGHNAVDGLSSTLKDIISFFKDN